MRATLKGKNLLLSLKSSLHCEGRQIILRQVVISFETIFIPCNVLFIAVPSAPEDFRATEITSNSATLEWKAPEKDGGAPITGYVIERREKTYGSWRPESTIKAPTMTHAVRRLIEGTDYYFRVCAENVEGKGPWTEMKEAVKPSKEKSKPFCCSQYSYPLANCVFLGVGILFSGCLSICMSNCPSIYLLHFGFCYMYFSFKEYLINTAY